MKTEIRKERTHLFSPSIHVSVMAVIDGKVARADLEAAVKTACKQNEMLQCRILLESDGRAFYESGAEKDIHIRWMEEKDDWKEVIRQQAPVPFALKDGELLRFFAWQEEKACRLLIVGHHLAGDVFPLPALHGISWMRLPGKRFPGGLCSCTHFRGRKIKDI